VLTQELRLHRTAPLLADFMMFNYSPMKIDILLGLIILSVLILAIYIHRTNVPSEDKNEGLGVAELIKGVKADLMLTERDSSARMFKVKSFDLEINFVVKSRQKAQGGVDYKVVTAGGESELSNERVQKIILHMEALETKANQQDPSDATPDDTPIPLASPPPTKEKKP
jgi:hypothetical protein